MNLFAWNIDVKLDPFVVWTVVCGLTPLSCNIILILSFCQGQTKYVFELDVAGKVEDVIQTLHQVWIVVGFITACSMGFVSNIWNN